MLVLTRKLGQSLMIGDDVEVVILGTEGDQVKVGVRAPREVQIFRKEVYDSIKETNQEAASLSGSLSVEDLRKMIKP
ncbi:hypothetical protein J31TS4_42680 [Paenibacillus sp. J31TS4]|uniref:carbon storage regulator CsrA n=1 Tax=Paenibacillus sp. J31TS4 TaxID=2807195 RepID=UPI001B128AF8|nr:carbon storage regulator CsrA [Paenibacillus sp. J31TS4]GIP40988.1 hypothetical protein J31TS4_42680 [Paenibacillus sp. J31TS4]